MKLKFDLKYISSNGLDIIDWLKKEFYSYYKELSYKEVQPVNISSGIDPTVRLIGSHLSVLKDILVNENIPDSGVFIIQDCIRTHNLKYAFDDKYLPKWGSHFTSFGVIANYSELDKQIQTILYFFTNVLNLKSSNIKLRINSNDIDLCNSCKKIISSKSIEYNSMHEEYYKHNTGNKLITGRNFNIAIENPKDGLFNDVGNVIVLEKQGVSFAVEVAIGINTILQQMYSLSHVYDLYCINLSIENPNSPHIRKFQDSIIVSSVLISEGLLPNSSNNRCRLLKTYLKLIFYYKNLLMINDQLLIKIISGFHKLYFENKRIDVLNIILSFINKYESFLLQKKHVSEIDKNIYCSININNQ